MSLSAPDNGKKILRLLLVEQNSVDAEFWVSTLRSSRYDVSADLVSSPGDFLARLMEKPYDLVLAAFNICGWSGMEALKLLRLKKKDIPFIVITEALGDELAVSCLQQGAADYVLKNHISSRLSQAVGRALKTGVGREKAERADEALRNSEDRLSELVENSVCGIYQVTVPGDFLHVNPALCRMLGYESKQELMALSASSVYRNAADRSILVEEYRRTGHVRGAEVEWKRKDGSPIFVRLSAHGVHDAAGELRCVEVIAEDISERRDLEKQLIHAQKFEAIGQLASGISHDFNNVIGAVMGWAELGSEQAPAGSRLQEYFKKISAQAGRAAGLTRQLLALAKRQILEPQDIQLNTIVTDVLNMLEKVIGKDIEIVAILAPALATIRADRSQVEQILMNLCLNARDAMPRGGRLVIKTENVEIEENSRRRKPGLSPGLHVQLIVSDNGTGMDAATREHIFEPFFTTKDPGKGTGLGLATVFGIVRQHEGFVTAESELGRGTTFRIYLPARPSDADIPEKCQEVMEAELRGGKETVLIADDHEGIRDMARAALEAYGYSVLLATDGENAVHIFHERGNDISLVVLDAVMPRLGGPGAAALIHEIRPDLPVIFTTDSAVDKNVMDITKGSCSALLLKPYDPKSLARTVRELLDSAAVPAGVAAGVPDAPKSARPHDA